MQQTVANPLSPSRLRVLAQASLLFAATIFFSLHFVHLTADFPNHSPWMDWAKYTDEGWYGDAAIRHYQRGAWYVPGDFNPAAALPVWPVLELILFRFTGVSLAAARAFTVSIFGLILVTCFLLLRRVRSRPGSLAPATAVLLLAVSPFCYVFTRMAILEPLLVLLMLLSLLAAGARSHRLSILALGVLLPLMVLTKTTALFLFPAMAWLLLASSGWQLRPFLRRAVPAGTIALALWIGYFALFVRPHYLVDFRYLFSANGYTGITLATAMKVIVKVLSDGLWIGNILYPLGLLASAAGLALLLLRRRDGEAHPLLGSLILWAGGYAAFLAYHNNLQPRYYLVIAVPLTLLVPLFGAEFLHSLRAPRVRLAGCVVAAILVALIALPDARQTLGYVRTPEYTFLSAATQLHKVVASDPGHNPLVLSISGSDLSLMTGLPSICDDFGTMELAQRVATYRPGWYAAWNQVDDDKMEALAPLYRLHRVAAFPAYDDPDRNLLILYRLDPAGASPSMPTRRRKPVPRLLRTNLGQQPSADQLEH